MYLWLNFNIFYYILLKMWKFLKYALFLRNGKSIIHIYNLSANLFEIIQTAMERVRCQWKTLNYMQKIYFG